MTMSPRETVALTHALGQWLRKAAVGDDAIVADLAVDLADIIAAGEFVREAVDELLRHDPLDPREADAALTLAAEMEAQLFGEMREHLSSLEIVWPKLLTRLDELSPEG